MSLSTAAIRLAGSQIAVNAATTLITWVLLRFAAPEDIALIPLVTLVGGLLGVVLRMGSGTQVIREVPRILEAPSDDRRLEDVVGASIRTSILGALLCVPVVVGAWFWLTSGPLEGSPDGLVTALLLTAVVMALSYNSPLWIQAGRRYRMLAYVTAASSLLEQLASLALFLLWGPVGILAGIVAGRLVLIGGSTLLMRQWGLDWGIVAHRVRHPAVWIGVGAGALAVNSLMRFALVRSDTIVIAALLPPDQLAVYWVAYKLIAYLFTIAQSIFKPVVTELAAVFEDKARIDGLIGRTSMAVIVLFAGASGAVAAVAPWFMRYYGGQGYAVGATTMAILAAYAFGYALYSIPQSVVLASRDARALLSLEAVVGVASLVMSAVGAVVGGIEGVALGQLFGMLFGYVVASRAAARLTDALRLRWAPVIHAAAAVVCMGWVWLPGLRERLLLAPLAVGVGLVLFVVIESRVLARDSVGYWVQHLPGPMGRVLKVVSGL